MGNKLLQYLRHQAQDLETDGWTDISKCPHMTKKNLDFTRIEIAGTKIRAIQGHSVRIEYSTYSKPLDELLHYTYLLYVDSIMANGILPQRRQYVHLTDIIKRHKNRNVEISINAAAMYDDGHLFVQLPNGTWLTKNVPAKYIMETRNV